MRKRLLLVDDQMMLLDVMERQFQDDEAFEVVGVAASAPEAIRLAKELSPDVVMLDIDLGGGESGFDVLAALRAIPGAGPRVVMASMFDNPLYRTRAFRLGADAYVTKGVRFQTLRALLLDDRAYEAPAADADKFWRNAEYMVSASGGGEYQALSERERAIVREIVAGLPEKAVAADLGISVAAVNTYRHRAMKKLGATSRSDLLSMRFG